MNTINIKRLSIKELNILASKIIDELSIRDEEKKPSGDDFVEQICDVFSKEDKLEDELYQLESKKELIVDEIDRIQEALEELQNSESTLVYEYDIGVLK